MAKRILLTITLFLLCFVGKANAQTLSLSDYYILTDGYSWTYDVQSTTSFGTAVNYTTTKIMNGYYDVNYSGTTVTGHKIVYQGSPYANFGVERITANGLEFIADVDKDTDGDGIFTYTLYGTASSLQPDSPWLIAPATFAIGDVSNFDIKSYEYDSNHTPLGNYITTGSITFNEITSLAVAAGNFDDVLTLTYADGGSSSIMYMAKGVGLIKEEDYNAQNVLEDNWELTGYSTNAVPEPATMLLFGSGLVGAFIKRRKA